MLINLFVLSKLYCLLPQLLLYEKGYAQRRTRRVAAARLHLPNPQSPVPNPYSSPLGKCAIIRHPAPGLLKNSICPPIAAVRSRIPCSPKPVTA